MTLKRISSSIVLGGFFLAVVSVFQNCGDVKLLPKSTTTASTVLMKSLGEICSPASVSVAIPQKILMVVDMSASNVSEFDVQTPPFDYLGGVPNWWYYLGNQAYTECMDKTGGPCPLATDLPGYRFNALRDYLNNCPQNLNSLNTYGVIGFATFPIPPKNYTARSCEDQLTDKTAALADIQGLNDVQTDDLSKSGIMAASYPFKMGLGTGYINAIKCLEERIKNDVSPVALQKDYKVLFLTDGKPSEVDSYRNPLPNSDYVNAIKNVQTFLQAQGYRLLFQPIFYGSSLGVAEQTTALQRLNAMAAAVNPGVTTITLNPGDFTSQLSSNLCSTPVETVNTSYNIIGKPQYVPLTSIQQGDTIYADQDLDGINDDIEDQLPGYDKTNSRSNGKVLDSLCYLYQADCTAWTPTAVCNPTQIVGFGFTDCDRKFINEKVLKIASTGAKPFDGLDYDGDGVLDYVELIKGSNPFVADMTADADGDGKSNLDEISVGTDPNSFTDAAVIAKYQVQILTAAAKNCPTGKGFALTAKQLPFVTVNANAETYLTPHAQDENVYAMIYFAKPVAVDTKRLSVFVSYIKMDKDKNVTKTTPVNVGVIALP